MSCEAFVTHLVTFKGFDAAASLRAAVSARSAKLPHLDGPVETSTDKVLAVGREGNAVDTILVTVGALETLDQEATSNVPDPDALVQRAGCYKSCVRGNGNRGDTIFDTEGHHPGAILNVPQANGPVATA